MSALLQEFSEFSPVDPVAGNPNSLESRMFDGDFELGGMGPFLGNFPLGDEDIPNLVKVDFNFGHFAAGPYGGQTYELDLAYAWNPGRRFSVLTDLAFMFSVDVGEALTGLGHFGLGPVLHRRDPPSSLHGPLKLARSLSAQSSENASRRFRRRRVCAAL